MAHGAWLIGHGSWFLARDNDLAMAWPRDGLGECGINSGAALGASGGSIEAL